MAKPQVYITHSGKTLPLSGWSRETGIPVTVLRTRRCEGWPVERMLTEPPRPKAKVTSAQAVEIRALRRKVDSGVVAARYGLTRRWVNAIWRGETWK